MEKPSTRTGLEADTNASSECPQPSYHHPHTLNDLPLYQAGRKTRYERRSRHNTLVVAIASVRPGGCHVEASSYKAAVLTQTLPQFTGTEHYYRLYPGLLLTDGAKYLADEAAAYWLLDVIWSHLPTIPEGEWFVCAKLERQREGASFTLEDGNGGVYARQAIPYTDFPLEEVTLYAARQDGMWIVLLPSEY